MNEWTNKQQISLKKLKLILKQYQEHITQWLKQTKIKLKLIKKNAQSKYYCIL